MESMPPQQMPASGPVTPGGMPPRPEKAGGESSEEGRKFARWAVIIGAVAIAVTSIYMIVSASLIINGTL